MVNNDVPSTPGEPSTRSERLKAWRMRLPQPFRAIFGIITFIITSP